MYKFLMVAGLLLGSLAGLSGTMPSVKAAMVPGGALCCKAMSGKDVMIIFVDGKKWGPGKVVYQDSDTIGVESGGRTYYFFYAQIREISY